MYIENMQTYNTFVYRSNKDKSLKSLLLDDMNFSVRGIAHTKNGQYTITVNNAEKPKDGHIKKGDIVKVIFNDEKSDYKAQYKDIEILYEDEDIIIVDKPAYMVVHPTKSHIEDTLLNYVQGIFEQKNIKSKVRFISRLDRDTSGIISIAKNPYAHYVLSQGFLKDKVQKYYTAIVNGDTSHINESGTINEKIEKSEDGIKRVVSPTGQDAITHYKILKKNGEITVLELLLETGRTHQIRVHLSYIGLPILGDELYGGNMSNIKRQALHCHKLNIVSPRTMKEVTVVSKLPDDMQNLTK